MSDGATMARVVYAPFKRPKTGKKPRSVTAKRVKTANGKSVTIHTVNADSSTFGDDLTYVFRQNVKRARKANKQLAGLPGTT
jgi:hypothetical protein